MADIVARLARLRAKDEGLKGFGADEHEYRNSPMSEADVEEFEQWMTVPFPPAFRDFLLVGQLAGSTGGDDDTGEDGEPDQQCLPASPKGEPAKAVEERCHDASLAAEGRRVVMRVLTSGVLRSQYIPRLD
ncbi:hypothetical protein JOF56_000747 [Kibdelosporangium banguiense]|uniref:SMI1/KNR4 family protein n=1 Tax=Kibdelosporangium banguiense TaxID=1365924 RepID=A0ABS4T7H6_9PSEU|nr:SMI1/KNR4 family protein [Kibdelosporangium banguiense]MBP2320362.1 hypothetical protein [Kibdelosporangium banguiense]